MPVQTDPIRSGDGQREGVSLHKQVVLCEESRMSGPSVRFHEPAMAELARGGEGEAEEGGAPRQTPKSGSTCTETLPKPKYHIAVTPFDENIKRRGEW